MAEEAGEKKKEGGKLKSLGAIKSFALYGVAMVAMTAVAFFLVTRLAGQNVGPRPMGQTSNTEGQPDNVDDSEDDNGDEDAVGPEYDFEDLVVNPHGTGGTRFVKIRIIAVLSSSSVAGKIDARRSQLTHKLVVIIKSKTIEEMDGAEGAEALQKDIKEGLNSVLGKGKVKQVYFVEFTIQ